ncbi:unnamed protein product [Caenorhabditis sp. 36 PRJEB53466]|nr:unnamed protein product [Caenorhabditis sp. 36 PRJEB53466]
MTTNMQHYMDDIHDLLDGLDNEMGKRIRRIERYEDLIATDSVEIKTLEELVFDLTRPLEQRTAQLCRLADLKNKVRALSEKKTTMSERNSLTVQAIYSKISEIAYHCKLEVEIDNPGCTEHRERLFCQSLDVTNAENSTAQTRAPVSSSNSVPTGRSAREKSVMTDDDRTSTRSGTPFEKVKKRGVGRPRNSFKLIQSQQNSHGSSAMSSARSSLEHEYGGRPERKKLSKYMKKKQEKLRLAADEERLRKALEVKKEVDNGDYESFGLSGWDDFGTQPVQGPNEDGLIDDEGTLLDFLRYEGDGLRSPTKVMGAEMDGRGVYSMDLYPPGGPPEYHAIIDRAGNTRDDNNCDNQTLNSTSSTINLKRTNHAAATSSSSGEPAEKRKRNMLFGSIADTSFSGRPRKLTGRVTEMIMSNRVKEESRHKSKRESEEWCICDGVNVDSEMMVECENKNCRVEWFHFDCVGLTASPENEWYCPECRRLPINLLSPRRLNE